MGNGACCEEKRMTASLISQGKTGGLSPYENGLRVDCGAGKRVDHDSFRHAVRQFPGLWHAFTALSGQRENPE